MRIVLDGMGSDSHPLPEVKAAVAASRDMAIDILLVGQAEKLIPLLENENTSGTSVEVVDAPEVFSMEDKISAGMLRRSKNSMAVGMKLVADGEADAFVTAGNTGGALANGLAQLRRIKGVKRPALSTLLPVYKGHAIALDIGANADCKPIYLVQFAIMGSIYAEKLLGLDNPRVGLLSNGEEAGKGNMLVKDTYPILKESGVNFIGNVESKEVFGGGVDVVVMDGFTGNVFIKTTEAVAKFITTMIKDELLSSTRNKLGAVLAKPAFDALKKSLDPGEIGAAPLLGLNGLAFVGHGRSDDYALYNAVARAKKAVEANLLSSLRDAIEAKLDLLKIEEEDGE
ncbi:MAG: phosphate acyltransferase PlsX [Anaerolineales bacterium]|nr:phosphate acyltransferase PlsX [Anaerolineales bacterium]